MLTTSNFLGCFKLETGGLIIGWLSLISDVVCVLGCVAAFLVLCVVNCQDMKELLIQLSEAKMDSFDEEGCHIARIVMIIVFVICALVAFGFAIISYLCIKGVENRDYVRVRPMLIVSAIMTVTAFLGIFSFTLYGIFTSVFYGVIYGYMFIVLYSLFDTFKQEYLGGSVARAAAYQMPARRV